jgi:ribosome-associated protein
VLDVSPLTSVTDYLVLCSGESERQVLAIAESVDHALTVKREPPLSIEGTSTAQWVLLDCGDVVAHVFRQDIRDHYGLEKLWIDAKRVRLPARLTEPPAATRPAAAVPPRRTRQRG